MFLWEGWTIAICMNPATEVQPRLYPDHIQAVLKPMEIEASFEANEFDISNLL